jgi:HEAT repeat protein
MTATDRFQYLVAQLSHVIPTMRYNAARSLGELGDARAQDALLAAFKTDKSPAVREAARIALTELGCDPAKV